MNPFSAESEQSKFSARASLRIGFAGVTVLLIGLVGWSVSSSISGAIVASGEVKVTIRDRVVEHLDGGTVAEILVADGEVVSHGQILIRLDSAKLKREEGLLEIMYLNALARKSVLDAVLQDSEKITWDPLLEAQRESIPDFDQVISNEENLFQMRREKHLSQIAQLEERIEQTAAEVAGRDQESQSLQHHRQLILKEIENRKRLVDRQLLAVDDLAKLEYTQLDLASRDGRAIAEGARSRGLIAELEFQILQTTSQFQQISKDEALRIQARIAELEKGLNDVRANLRTTDVRAPVSGKIFDMKVFTPREVVKPGEIILRIVPQEPKFVVIAKVEPNFIDQTFKGQQATLLFSAFSSQTTPSFNGKVVRVAPDIVDDERTGASWYEIEVAVESPIGEDSVVKSVDDLELLPGMPVEVQIKTGDRTILSYLFKPMKDFFGRSLRED